MSSQKRRRTPETILALFALLSVAACGGAPRPLGGMWSSSRAACAAGLGVTFRADAVRARFKDDQFVLLSRPRYDLDSTPGGATVRITYALPAHTPFGRLGVGVIELDWSRAEGRLTPLGRRFVDLRTGAARVPLKAESIDRALALVRCPKQAPASGAPV